MGLQEERLEREKGLKRMFLIKETIQVNFTVHCCKRSCYTSADFLYHIIKRKTTPPVLRVNEHKRGLCAAHVHNVRPMSACSRIMQN